MWDVIVPAPARLDAAYLSRVRHLQERLRGLSLPDRPDERALTKVISLVDAIDSVDSDPILARLTADPEPRVRWRALAMPTFMGALRSTQLDPHGEGRLRIMLRAPERQPAQQKQWLINEVTQIAREEFPADEESAGAEVTGFYRAAHEPDREHAPRSVGDVRHRIGRDRGDGVRRLSQLAVRR